MRDDRRPEEVDHDLDVEADARRGFEGEVYDPEEATPESEGVVYTAGISSVVLDGDDAVGHVLLVDADDADAFEVHGAASSMDGIAAVLMSSDGSYHLWDLSVRTFEEAILDGLSWRIADPQHVAQSRRRGYYVLRATAKVREGGETYKEAPQLMDVYVPDDLDDAPPQSRPHLRRLACMADEQDLPVLGNAIPDVEEVETVGAEDGLSVDRYMTLDDAAKERLREA